MNKLVFLETLQKLAEKQFFDYEKFAIDCDESNFDTINEVKSHIAKMCENGEITDYIPDFEAIQHEEDMKWNQNHPSTQNDWMEWSMHQA